MTGALRFGAVLGVVSGVGAIAGCVRTPEARLPPESPRAADLAEVDLSRGDGERGMAGLLDRGFGRTGLACADCHAIGPDMLRPAPSLGGAAERTVRWAGAEGPLPVVIGTCVERYQARPPPSPAEVADLVAGIRSIGAAGAVEAPAEGAALYDAACRHCHEGGPGGALVGRPWTEDALRHAVRGRSAPVHPGRLMPAFDAARLPDAGVETLVDWLRSRPRTFRPVAPGAGR
jgi:mono/diheme cytochrome c family protein